MKLKFSPRLHLILSLTILSAAAQPPDRLGCKHTSFAAEVFAGQHFARSLVSGLTFRLTPTGAGPKGQREGWQISLGPSDAPDIDFIYPVNLPLRFNGVQLLGANYGNDAKASLADPHEMRFLLNQADFDQFRLLVTNALWPYSAPRPEQAGDEYLQALKTTPTGWLKLTVLSYDVDRVSDSLQRLKFRAGFIVPRNFRLAKELKPKPAACPAPPQ